MTDLEPPFEVEAYSHQALMKLLTKGARTAPDSLERRIHGVYFKEYFEYLGARTVVVENRYVDQNFLDDYAAYYVGCFHEYERFCRRLHFFNVEFDDASFSKLIEGSEGKVTKEILQKSYLGFVVVKPLPTTLIGRTCLKTYGGSERYYPITQTYTANLFGIPLSIDTIAFQEQDKVTAACATSALWSALHCTGKTFHHVIPSPHEITSTAKKGSVSRVFPHKDGLTFPEMAHVVRAVGLEPFVIGGAQDRTMLGSTLYAYLSAKIPVVLGLLVFDKAGKKIDRHAVTVTGFHLADSRTTRSRKREFRLKSDRIDKIYAHDDQVGPFARMAFMKGGLKKPTPFWLTTSYGGVETHYVIGEHMLIPVDRNIRIPFSTISDAILQFDHVLKDWARETPSAKHLADFEWDIFLSSVNDFKSDVFASFMGDPNRRQEILTSNLPKFLWRAKASIGDRAVLELVFDSTDIEQGRLLLSVVERDGDVAKEIRGLSEYIMSDPEAVTRANELRTGPIFEHFGPQISK